jgi:hypothetical protein
MTFFQTICAVVIGIQFNNLINIVLHNLFNRDENEQD